MKQIAKKKTHGPGKKREIGIGIREGKNERKGMEKKKSKYSPRIQLPNIRADRFPFKHHLTQ